MKKPRVFKQALRAVNSVLADNYAGPVVFHGDCLALLKRLPDASISLVVSSPPYCMGKEYESTSSVDDFVDMHAVLMPEIVRVLKPGGSICWQIGNHVKDGAITPLDFLVFSEMRKFKEMRLRNRIIWSVGHGLHCLNRFSGRHETIMWYTKGNDYFFNLDAVRGPQKYPGKTYSSGPKKGQPSSHPLGKNPGDVWEIPQVKANHIEKTEHPCQFPVALPQILIKAMTQDGDIVMDPFRGSGSTGVAATLENRRFIGAELDGSYVEIALRRLELTADGTHRVRPWDRQIEQPSKNTKWTRVPEGHLIQPSDVAALLLNDETTH